MNISKLILITLIILIINIIKIESVDQNQFRTCEDSHFCKRNMKGRTEQSSASDTTKIYKLLENTIQLVDGVITADIIEDGVPQDVLALELMAYQDNMLRFRIKEKNLLQGKKRYQVQDVLLPTIQIDRSIQWKSKPQNNQFTIEFGSNHNLATVNMNPFRVDVLVNGKVAVSANNRGYMHFEQMKEKPTLQLAPPKPPVEGEEQNNNEQNEEEKKFRESLEGLWEEKFHSHHDSKPNGPTSIGMDFKFVGSQFVYGIPEHASTMALKNTKGEHPYRLYNLDVFEYELDKTMALYGAVPLMLSHDTEKTVGVFWLNAAETYIDIEDSKTEQPSKDTHWISESGIMDVFILTGPSPKEFFVQYATLTGTTALPQMFSIAYHQSRWNYKSEEDVRQVDQAFDDNSIPYDVIWLDIEHTDGKRYFTWDRSNFPTPENMLAELDKKSRKLVTIVDPHIKKDSNYYIYSEASEKGYYVKNKDRNDFEGWCWPGTSSYLDFTNPVIRDWWSSQFAYDKYKGSAKNLYIWNDMNEPSVFGGPEVSMHKDNIHYGDYEHRDVHNLYGYYYHMATAQGLIQRNPDHNDRPFVLSRAFFAGTQRIGAIWTGDNAAKWDHLAISNPMLLSLGLAGITFSGADVGGFFGNPDAELVARWYQAAAFQPFFRGHAHLDARRREPWLFGEPYTTVIRQAIQARYSYLPLWYTAFYQNNQTGMPVLRPLWVEFPQESALFAVEDHVMVADSLLVKPVVQQGQTSTNVILPGGESQLWFEVDTLKKFQGGQTVEISTPLEKIPVFQRGGTIVPKKERVRRSSSQMREDPYTLVIALDKNQKASGQLYIDDEHSFNHHRSNEYLYKQLTFENGKLTYKDVPQSKGKYNFENTVEKVVILGLENKPSKIETSNKDTLSFEYDQSTQKLTIRKPLVSVNSDWTISLN
ncbi:alpha-glucosidase II [Tieghemostelium lacteum]|uniref:Glucosidase II subunit alpha n=1 Tax=Tieghemostelium lacteum TaxID=361077 RepID=A0A151ZAS9_TIELA|nr:alpha-glucosidase II [Tieghemostelium lacteum]|eukprot:KYQ91049.1 alpha-glucosidase II [Tieghemostelium lacteum]